MLIFADGNGTQNRGRVQVITPPGAAPGSLIDLTSPPSRRQGGADLPWGGFANFKSLITDVTIAEQTNHQFLHTLGGDIYIYSFGDRIGILGVGGLAFYDNCTGNQRPGVSHVLEYFRRAKLSEREEPMKLTIAPDTVLRGFLYRFRAQVTSVEQRLFQFHLDMALVPEKDLL